MAEEIVDEGPLEKLSWHRIQIEDASNNVLLVVLKHDSGIYRGVLLNQTANAPYGIYLPELHEEKENKVYSSDLTSNVVNKGQSMANTVEPSEESALSYRHTYQPELLNSSSIQVPSPICALSRPLKNTNLRKRMLRPRHILCSKCKVICDDEDLKTGDALVNSSIRKRKEDFEYSLVDKRHKKERKNCVPSKLGAKPIMSCFPTINYGKQEALIQKNDNTNSKSSNVDTICSSQSSEYEKELNANSESPSISLTRIDNMTKQSNAEYSSAVGQEKWNEGNLENHEKVRKHKHKHKKKHKKHKHKDVDNHDKHNHKKRHKKSKKRDICGQSTLTSSLASSEGSRQLTQGDRVVLNAQSFDNNNLNIYSSESFQDKLNSSGEQTTSSPLLMDSAPISDSESNDTYEFPLPETMQENVATLRPLMMRIQSRDVFKSTLPDGRTVSVGDITWGKIHGFPAWPGRVISITISQRDNGVIITQTAHVSWFGSRTRSHMPITDLHPFLEDFKIKFNKKKRGPYKNAVKQALLAAQAVSAVADVDIEG